MADITRRLGWRHLRSAPTAHVRHHRRGKLVHDGTGLSFWFHALTSSGVLVGTGTGATGWLRSLWRERGGGPALPAPAEPRLVWYVREAWPSPATGTSLVQGALTGGQRLRLTVESDRLVAFGDGMESDALELTWGQTVRLGVADTALRLLV